MVENQFFVGMFQIGFPDGIDGTIVLLCHSPLLSNEVLVMR
jgi:hypothetical protein